MEDRKFICPCYRHERDIAETGHCLCHLFVSDDYQPMEVGSSPIQEEGSVSVAGTRDLFKTSRKYALGLLEHLDAENVTRRVGDERVLY